MKMHLALPVTDIAAARDFYATLFAAEPSKLKPDYVKFEPPHLALNISFYLASGKVDTQRHLGLQLASRAALDREYERLQAAELVVGERAQSVCCYADQDKFWVADPDGYAWELYFRVADTAEKLGPETSCCGDAAKPSTCC